MPRKSVAAAKPKQPTEAEITKQIRAWLDTMPDQIWYLKVLGQGGVGGWGDGRPAPRQKYGVPDFLLCVNGFFVGLEVKSKKGKLTATQEKEFPKIEKARGPIYVVRSLEDAQRELEPYLATSALAMMI